MSRVGRQPIPVPAGVQVKVAGSNVAIKGPKGELTRDLGAIGVKVTSGNELVVEQGKADPAGWGLARALLANMVKGVTDGFTKTLEVHGVGYKAAVAGKTLKLELGFSHPVDVQLPEGVEAKVVKNQIVLTGFDNEQLGDFAAQVRRLRPPEPYKGKGIRYADEHVRQKEGKKAAAEAGGGA
ncbi:MAG: 50S ribosomal protein L6 [Candidatus Andersenbacteria bacterium]